MLGSLTMESPARFVSGQHGFKVAMADAAFPVPTHRPQNDLASVVVPREVIPQPAVKTANPGCGRNLAAAPDMVSDLPPRNKFDI